MYLSGRPDNKKIIKKGGFLMKKLLIAIMTLCLLAGSLSACSGNTGQSSPSVESQTAPSEAQSSTVVPSNDTQPGDPQPETPVLPDGSVILNVMGGANLISTTEVALKGYLEQNSNVTINFEKYSYSEYPVKLRLQLSSGDAIPDVMLVHDLFMPQLIYNGWLMDLTDMIPMDDVLPVFNSASKDGRYYGIPNQASTLYAFMYRQDVYDQLGLQPPSTWDEYYEQGLILKEHGYYAGAYDPTAGSAENIANTFVNYMGMLGGDVFDSQGAVSLDKGVEALTMLKKAYDAGILHKSVSTSSDGDFWTVFNEGKIAAAPGMSFEAARYLSNADPQGPAYGQMRLAPIMKFLDDGPDTYSSSITYFVINAKTANEQAAKHLVNWLTLSEEGCVAFANVDAEGIVATYTTAYIPGIQKVIDTGITPWDVFGGQQVTVDVAKILLDARPAVTYKDARYPEAETIMAEILSETFINNKYTPEQAIEEMKVRIGKLSA